MAELEDYVSVYEAKDILGLTRQGVHWYLNKLDLRDECKMVGKKSLLVPKYVISQIKNEMLTKRNLTLLRRS